MDRLIKIFIAVMVVFSTGAVQAQSLEFRIKALLIEKFARFTEWGAPGPGDTFEIAVLGESPFDGELEKIAATMKLKNKRIKIRYIGAAQEASECQVLFICASEKGRLGEILRAVEHRKILTISDTQGFGAAGVHLNMYIDELQTIKYEVNPRALTKANLNVQMQLLSFGKIIHQ